MSYYGEIDETIPHGAGVYILGQTAFNPYTHQEYYLLKVGMGKDIYKRLKAYSTHNPAFWIIDTYETDEKDAKWWEEQMHNVLFYNFPQGESIETVCNIHSTEWTSVSREVYLAVCEYGYNAFDATAAFGNFEVAKKHNFDVKPLEDLICNL